MEKRIKELREERHMSQMELAEELGISIKKLNAIELDTQRLTSDILIAAAEYFGVSTDYILGLSDKEGVMRDIKRKEYLLNCLDSLTERNRNIVMKFMAVLRENND
ncbi:MAG: helix-turn-helix transcriptional regulator [Lachnospiraceae bacterium]|nr:helix-turn-helix transcriptional regulator [Lachnospiraceae bacterium]